MSRLHWNDGDQARLEPACALSRLETWPLARKYQVRGRFWCTLRDRSWQKNADSRRTNCKLWHGTHTKTGNIYACSLDMGWKRTGTVQCRPRTPSQSCLMCSWRRTLRRKRHWVRINRVGATLTVRVAKCLGKNWILCETYLSELVSQEFKVIRYLWRKGRRRSLDHSPQEV